MFRIETKGKIRGTKPLGLGRTNHGLFHEGFESR